MSQAIRIGLITGILVAVLFLIETNVPMSQALLLPVHYGGTLAMIAGIYVAIKRTRDREQKGLLEVKQGLKHGMKAAVAISLLFMIAVFINFNYITDLDFYLTQQHPATKVKFTETPSFLRMITVPFLIQQSFHFAIPTMMVGFFAAIGSSFVLRKGTGMLNEN